MDVVRVRLAMPMAAGIALLTRRREVRYKSIKLQAIHP